MRHYLLFVTILFFIACGSNKSESETVKKGEAEESVQTQLWSADLDANTGKLILAKDKPSLYDTLSVDRVIELMNSLYPNIKLQLDKVSNDTVYVSIPEASFLTQQMGSSGPTVYFADVVFNLAEMPGIRYVSFNFEEGDHAAPAVMSKESITMDFEATIK